MVGDDVLLLAWVTREIEEHFAVPARAEEFPIPRPHGGLVPKAPVKIAPRRFVFSPRQQRQEIDAVQDGIGRQAGCGVDGSRNVQGDDRFFPDGAGSNPAGPRGEERHADTALGQHAFLAVERIVARAVPVRADFVDRQQVLHRRPVLRTQWRAVVAEEKDQRVVAHFLFFEQIEDAPHPVIDRRDHGQCRAASFGHVAGKPGEVFVGGDERHVRRVIGEVEKERLGVILPAEESQRRVGLFLDAVILRGVHFPLWCERTSLQIVIAQIVLQFAPVEILETALTGAIRQLQGPRHGDTLRIVCLEGGVFFQSPSHGDDVRLEVPFAGHARDIACRAETVGDGFFLQRQRSFGDRIIAKALLVASGQQTRPRRRALRGGDVAVRKDRTLAGQAVEVGRLHVVADAVRTEVGIALVVGEDDDEVRAVG